MYEPFLYISAHQIQFVWTNFFKVQKVNLKMKLILKIRRLTNLSLIRSECKTLSEDTLKFMFNDFISSYLKNHLKEMKKITP